MDRTVARMNIGRFRKLLAEERDSRKRETIRLLLEAEERKLAALTQGGQALPRRASVLDTTSRIGCYAPEQVGKRSTLRGPLANAHRTQR